MTSALGRGLKQALDSLDLSQAIPLQPDSKIPLTPRSFYHDFGAVILHPRTKEPVGELAGYQYEVSEALFQYKRVLEIKSNKCGQTTASLINDFHLAVLPSSHPMSCRGYDQLIISQSLPHSREHIRTLRKLIASSKYAGWLIDSPQEIDPDNPSMKSLLRSEQSKVSVIFIRNPTDERQPSRIIGLSLDNPGALASWKNVRNIHISDATMAIGDIHEALDLALSRLVNNAGSCLIETVPGNPKGAIFDMYQRYLTPTVTGQLKQGDFFVKVVTADQAVAAGIIDKQTLEGEREHDPQAYRRLYMAEFASTGGNVFSIADIDKALELGKALDDKYGVHFVNKDASKAYGIDPGFGSSAFGECIFSR